MSMEIKEAVDKINIAFTEFKNTHKEAVEQSIKGYVDPLLSEELKRVNEAVTIAEEAKEAAEKTQANFKRLNAVDDQKAEQQEKHREISIALKKYWAGGKENLSYQENQNLMMHTKSMTTLEASDGGYAVIPEMEKEIIRITRETSPIRQYADVVTIGSDRLEQPYQAGDFESGWVGETEARPETATGQINMLSWDVHEQYANPAISQKLLDDAYFDIEAYVTQAIADKFARSENTAFLSGDGVKKPRGILNYASGTSGYNQIEQINSGSAGNITGDALINLMGALKSPFLSNAVFVMKRSAITSVRLLKDGNNNYIWSPGFQGQPSTLFGYPIVHADDMPTPASASLSVIFGNLKEGYRIVERQGIRVLRDPYTHKPYVHLYTTKRIGGGVKNFEALKILKLSV